MKRAARRPAARQGSGHCNGARIPVRRPGVPLPGARMAAVPLLWILAAGCQEALPTAAHEDLVPKGVTVEVMLPFSDFAENARVFGGYGRASDLGGGFIARDFGGEDAEDGLEAATLVRFGNYPTFVSVLDTTGTTRPDSSLTFLSGRIVARFDTGSSVVPGPGPVRVRAQATTEPWDGVSATWQFAVDTLNHRVSWSIPGGGAVEEIGSAVWDVTAGDSLEIEVDSVRVASWADASDLSRGVRLTTDEPGVRLRVRSARLWLETLPSIRPDTLLQVRAATETTTFVYDPAPAPPGDALRVGGAPAWRTVLSLQIPEELRGPPELCAKLGCPFVIDEDHVSYAGLLFTSRETPRAFAPSDTLSMDLRAVLAPDFLPKSPLGPSMTGIIGKILEPEWFSSPAGNRVEVPVTRLVRDLLRGETTSGDPVTGTVALLSTFEPLSLEYASFAGKGASAPRLRLILTFSDLGGG